VLPNGRAALAPSLPPGTGVGNLHHAKTDSYNVVLHQSRLAHVEDR